MDSANRTPNSTKSSSISRYDCIQERSLKRNFQRTGGYWISNGAEIIRTTTQIIENIAWSSKRATGACRVWYCHRVTRSFVSTTSTRTTRDDACSFSNTKQNKLLLKRPKEKNKTMKRLKVHKQTTWKLEGRPLGRQRRTEENQEKRKDHFQYKVQVSYPIGIRICPDGERFVSRSKAGSCEPVYSRKVGAIPTTWLKFHFRFQSTQMNYQM